jgi:general nucleoside transport system permease protein
MAYIDTLAALCGTSIDAGTALALASLGLLLNERSGVVNLGAEGMMLVGALAGFATTVHTQQSVLGFVAAALAGAALAAVFGVLVIWLDTNQYATGLAASLLGAGVSAFAGVPYTRETLGKHAAHAIGALADLPGLGPAFFRHDWLVYAAALLAIALHCLLLYTRAGLVVRGVGESPETAHALGYPVRRIRLACVATGGALCGVAGAYLSVVYTPLWAEGMTAGKGWIALALTTFATWKPLRVLLGAYLFGAITMLQLHLQGEGVRVPSQLLAMSPYLATILVLVLISRGPAKLRGSIPASLGKPFTPGARTT